MIFGCVDEIAVEFAADEIGYSNFLLGRCCLAVNGKKYFQTFTKHTIWTSPASVDIFQPPDTGHS